MTIICRECGIEKPVAEFKRATDRTRSRINKRCYDCRVARQEREAAGLRRCFMCGETKPVEEFSMDSETRRAGRCKHCASDGQYARSRAKGKRQKPRRYSAIGTEETGFVCCMCNIQKPATEFRKQGNGYWDYRCKECFAKRARIGARIPHTRYRGAISRAKRKGCEWSLTFELFIELTAKPCHYCGFPLNIAGGIGLDRKDSKLGYHHDNVVPCCFICNLVKGPTFTVEEMELLGKSIASVKQARVAAGLSFDHEYVGWGRKRKYN